MALIFADDFQQWNTSISTALKAGGLYPQYLGQDVPGYLNEVAGLNIYTPSYAQGYGGGNSILFTLYYDTQKGALCCVQPRSPADTQVANASGYRRLINYDGDTLYFSAVLEMGSSAVPTGADFLIFGSAPDQVVFTTSDQVGSYLYGVGIDTNGFYTFNGVSTTVQAYYRPATFPVYFDVVFGPDYMELWINNTMALRQTRSNIRLKEFGITAGGLVKTTNAQFCIWVHSVGVADNTEGFGQRFGRKRVKTEPVTSVPVQESTLQGSGVPATVLTRFASGPTNESDGQMLGSLVSPLPFVRNDFGGTRSATKKPYAAAVALQSKRLFPAADGLSLHPYVTIAGSKVYGNKVLPSSTWKDYFTEVKIAPGQTFSAFNFGYEHDYTDLNRIYAADRNNVEIYGEGIGATGSWYSSTDLIAYDSTLYKSGGFADFNGKFMAALSDTANLPYKAGQSFKYGEGIHLSTDGGIFAGTGVLSSATTSSPFTIDFWCKETENNTSSGLWFLRTTPPASVNDRVLMGTHDVQLTKLALWNNTSNARVITTYDSPLSSTSWRHYAIVYDGTVISLYIDGVLFGTITWSIIAFTTRLGIARKVNNTTSQVIIERYRMRKGTAWTANFDPETIYN